MSIGTVGFCIQLHTLWCVASTNIGNVGEMSHHYKRRNLTWPNVTPPTNVTTFKMSQTLRTTNVPMGHNTFLSPFSIANSAISSHPA